MEMTKIVEVCICDNICNSCDLCQKSNCPFYDLSFDATQKFNNVIAIIHQEPWLLKEFIANHRIKIKNCHEIKSRNN